MKLNHYFEIISLVLKGFDTNVREKGMLLSGYCFPLKLISLQIHVKLNHYVGMYYC